MITNSMLKNQLEEDIYLAVAIWVEPSLQAAFGLREIKRISSFFRNNQIIIKFQADKEEIKSFG